MGALVLAAVVALTAAALLKGEEQRFSSRQGMLLRLPGIEPEEAHRRVAGRLWKGDMPEGFAFLEFVDFEGRVGLDGRRNYRFLLRGAPRDVRSITISEDHGEPLSVPLGPDSGTPIRIDVPLWGFHDYTIRVTTASGELMPFTLELPGMLALRL